MTVIELIREPIAVDTWVGRVSAPDCGAVITFLGVVRDHHHQLVAQEVRLFRPQQTPLSEIAHGLLSGGDVQVGGGAPCNLLGQRLRCAVANGYDVSRLVLE